VHLGTLLHWRDASALVSSFRIIRGSGPAQGSKKIAAVITEYRHNSHADVVVGKFLEGYHQDGKPPRPKSRVVSMFTDQVPEGDLSRAMSKKHGVPIYPPSPRL